METKAESKGGAAVSSSDIVSLRPPKGYDSWLDYAIATMGTRDLYYTSIWEEGKPDSHWGREVQRHEMREAAQAELNALGEWKR